MGYVKTDLIQLENDKFYKPFVSDEEWKEKSKFRKEYEQMWKQRAKRAKSVPIIEHKSLPKMPSEAFKAVLERQSKRLADEILESTAIISNEIHKAEIMEQQKMKV